MDVATKIAGRLAELAPHEGDMVEAGAGNTLKRSESLVEKGFISKSKLDTDQTGMEGAMAGMDQAQSRIASAPASLPSRCCASVKQ